MKLRLHLPDDESYLHLPTAAGRPAPAAAHRVPRVVPDPGPGWVPDNAFHHPQHLQHWHCVNLINIIFYKMFLIILTVAEFMVRSASRIHSSMSHGPLPPAWPRAQARPIIVCNVNTNQMKRGI